MKEGFIMWEIDIKNKISGELDIIFGYNITDAFQRYNLNPNEWIILNTIYVD